ncbi:MAG: hypothetical protein HY814_00460 [Candidatus Riflebacteria bacterium]|nr:hypothetical protein [Candidatus Riflebacteria bacterium]
MVVKSLALMLGLLVLASPALAASGSEKANYEGLEKVRTLPVVTSQKIIDSVQARLPQAEIANLLTQLEEMSKGDGPMSVADAGKLEDEIARQRQFWQAEYEAALKKGAPAADFEESATLDKGFDDLFASALGSDPSAVTPEDLKVILEEYDLVSQTFQQLKLARFLAGNKEGISRYNGAADRQETASIAAEVQDKYLPAYQKRMQTGIVNLRKMLVDAKPAAN